MTESPDIWQFIGATMLVGKTAPVAGKYPNVEILPPHPLKPLIKGHFEPQGHIRFNK